MRQDGDRQENSQALRRPFHQGKASLLFSTTPIFYHLSPSRPSFPPPLTSRHLVFGVLQVEATKFTEVGFHGRDVDQIIRDLIEVSVNMTKKR